MDFWLLLTVNNSKPKITMLDSNAPGILFFFILTCGFRSGQTNLGL